MVVSTCQLHLYQEIYRSSRQLPFFVGCWSECDVTYGILAMAAIVCWQSEADCAESKSEPNVWNTPNWVVPHGPAGGYCPGGGTPCVMGDTYVPRFWPPFFTLAGSSTIFLGYFFSSTNTKTIFCGIITTNSYRIRSFRPQISFFPRSFWVQFSAASGTPPSFFGPSTPPGVLCISMQWLRLKGCHVACDECASGEICSHQHMRVTGLSYGQSRVARH